MQRKQGYTLLEFFLQITSPATAAEVFDCGEHLKQKVILFSG